MGVVKDERDITFIYYIDVSKKSNKAKLTRGKRSTAGSTIGTWLSNHRLKDQLEWLHGNPSEWNLKNRPYPFYITGTHLEKLKVTSLCRKLALYCCKINNSPLKPVCLIWVFFFNLIKKKKMFFFSVMKIFFFFYLSRKLFLEVFMFILSYCWFFF